MLRSHWLKRNESTRTPTSCLFVDTETSPSPGEGRKGVEVHRLRLACGIYCCLDKGEVVRRQAYTWRTQGQFWDTVRCLMNAERPLWLFAHNLGFDLSILGLWEAWERGEWLLTDPRPTYTVRGEERAKKAPRRGFVILEDPPVLISLFNAKGHKIVLCDTFNYWRESLASIGQSLGMTKGDYDDAKVTDERLESYCQNDAAIVETAVLNLMTFTRTHDLGVWKGTAPSLAFAAFRHRFMSQPPLIDGNQAVARLVRAAYYGGECRLSYCGVVRDQPAGDAWADNPYHPGYVPTRTGKVYYLDLPSAYPWVMRDWVLPYKMAGIQPCDSVKLLARLCSNFGVAAIVKIQSDTVAYPRREDGRVRYLIGDFWTALCGDELANAIVRGHVAAVRLAAMWQRCNLFRDFVSYFVNLRSECKAKGDDVSERWAKLMANGLLGKFGQRSPRWIDREDIPAPLPWGRFTWMDGSEGKWLRCRAVNWRTQIEGEPGESAESFPAIPAFVCSALREQMRALRSIAGENHVLYQDTDSLHVDRDGYERLQGADKVGTGELGRLRLVDTADYARYRAIRNYVWNDRLKCAGLKKNAVRVSDGVYEHCQFQRLSDILAKPPDGSVRVTAATFNVLGGDVGGTAYLDGRVFPSTLYSDVLPAECRRALWPDEMPQDDPEQQGENRLAVSDPEHDLGD